MTTTFPPIAKTQPTRDPYQWLQEKDHPDVLAYLEAENRYLENQMQAQQPLQEALFNEIKSRIRETDLSLPSPWGAWLYYSKTEAGAEYPRYYRCHRTEDSLEIDPQSEMLLLDPNALANDQYLSLGAFSVSPDQSKLAYSLDTQGDEIYRLFVKDLINLEVRELPFTDCDGSMVWANDNATLFFATLDDTHRPATLNRYRLGDSSEQTVFTEKDGRFFLSLDRSSSEKYLVLSLESKTTSEAWVLDANTPTGEFACVKKRIEGHEYQVDHGFKDGKWQWFIRTNQDGINFALYCAEEHTPELWHALKPHDAEVMLEDFTLNQQAWVLSLRKEGLPVIEVHPENGESYLVNLPDATYSLYVQDSLEFISTSIRLRYESLNRPAQIIQLDLATGTQTVLKQTPVEGVFNADAYQSLRLWAQSADGTRIPISVVGKKDVITQGNAPLYLYGYGAYGHSLDAWFSHARLSLLERGFIFAIAHVRGGGEMGENWYHQGKLEHKQNSFDDFIACAEHLITKGFTSSNKLAISGGSAGGLLMGAVLNQRPELFAAAIAEVPFVDVLNTMLDPELPLTVTEYDEWGNPEEPEVYARIKAYAPYENIRAQAYPAILAVAGYNDSRVQYWEAAKWVAKLRAHKTDTNLLLLKTEFGAGHGGMSGRYQALKDAALEYAFILKVLGLCENGR